MMRKLTNGFFRFLGSFGLAMALLLFLFLLTALGTWAQRFESLYEVQNRYFNSLFVIDRTFGFPLPLPGVYLLLAILGVNLLVGGFIRIRKSAATAGVLIVHFGIFLLLAAGLVEFYFSTKGHLTLFEGQRSDEYRSYYEWEIAIGEVGGRNELVVPGEKFMNLAAESAATFEHPDLPFTLSVGTIAKNSTIVPAVQRVPGDGALVGGFAVRPLPRAKEAEQDLAGLYVRVQEIKGEQAHDAILWGLSQAPYTVNVDGKRWYLELTHKRFSLPFRITLEDFRRQLHPRAGQMAKSFESDVIKDEQGASEKINISMNRPLRRKGYTLFQSSWGPSNAPEGSRLFSVFSVVKNPADQWPLYSCLVILAGLLIHFGRKIVRYVRAQSKQRAANAPVPGRRLS
ncbi:MAG: cytochrome c biogenesis protein ResB [Planctomycetota bacterium]|jgi:hypothetical protein